MNKSVISRSLPGAMFFTFVLAAAPAFAERPMAVDDAGTMDKGGAKIEFGWSKDDRTRGWDAAAGYGPIENLEIEASLERSRERPVDPVDPTTRYAIMGLAAKWVPLQAEAGLSAGLKLEYGRTRSDDRVNPKTREYARSLTGLASWSFESGQIAHLNLGSEWVHTGGATDATKTWGIGFDQPLTGSVQLTLETFGTEHGRPDKQVGLRWEVSEGLKLSAAAGRGSDRSFGSAGVAWEF